MRPDADIHLCHWEYQEAVLSSQYAEMHVHSVYVKIGHFHF